jgi:predicted nucleotide-binding protein
MIPSEPSQVQGIIASMSVLRLPLPQAQEQLARRIKAGYELAGFDPGNVPGTEVDETWWNEVWAFERRIEGWRDFNRTWLEKYLGGTAVSEYEIASTHIIRVGADNPAMRGRALQNEVASEVSKLESIRERLPLWVPEPEAGPLISPASGISPQAPIFIVHGSDTLRAESVAHTVSTATGRKTIILRDEPNLGRTLIEKFEEHAAEVSYAIIVLTPDDRGNRVDETDSRPRGRQNVVFEMGYFFGLIRRRNVSVLLRPGVEKPSDMDGIVYITFDDDRAWKTELFRELKHAGFDIAL